MYFRYFLCIKKNIVAYSFNIGSTYTTQEVNSEIAHGALEAEGETCESVCRYQRNILLSMIQMFPHHVLMTLVPLRISEQEFTLWPTSCAVP